MITVTGAFLVFNEPYILTRGGGPGTSSITLAVHMYLSGFFRDNMGYASTIAIVIFLITGVLGVLCRPPCSGLERMSEMGRAKAKSKWSNLLCVIVGLFLLAYAVVIVYPLLWMVMSSMKSYNEIYRNVWALPSEWLVSNYVTAWNVGISDYFLNSFLVTGATIVLVLARRFPGCLRVESVQEQVN